MSRNCESAVFFDRDGTITRLESRPVPCTATTYYSTARGVFLSEDPLGPGGGDANLYRYASNRPQMLVDPFGLTVTISYQGLVSAAHCVGSALAGGTLGYVCGYIEAWYNGDQNPARTAWREAVTGAVLGAAAGPIVGQLPGQMQLFVGIALAIQAVASGQDFAIRGLRATCIVAEFGIGGGLRAVPGLLRDARPPPRSLEDWAAAINRFLADESGAYRPAPGRPGGSSRFVYDAAAGRYRDSVTG